MKFNQMRIIMLGTVSALSPVVLVAQDPMPPGVSGNRPTQQQLGSPGTQDSGHNANEMAQTMKDKTFLRQAAEGGIAEVKLGQLAAQKASSDDVKAFGQKMVDDHTMLNNEMAPIADSMGVRTPKSLNKQDQAEYDKLNGLSGTDFDTEYLTVMVKDHHKDLHEFREEAASATDANLKAAVEKGLNVIREHTMMVDKLAQSKGIAVPQHGGSKQTSPPQ
jgi:putative membrane protein